MPSTAPETPRCWVTPGLLAVFACIFVLEQCVAARTGQSAPDLGVLVSTGGVSRRLAASGEVYRLLSAPFLHANFGHLAANAVAFWLVGTALERLIGAASTFCVFALGGLAGSVASITLNASGVVTVGASGAIMAMLMTLLLATLAMEEGQARTRMQIRSIWIMVMAILPAARHPTLNVDYAAHFGGALLGAAYGVLLLAVARDGTVPQRFADGEDAAAALAACAIVLSFCAVLWRYPAYAALTAWIPQAELPHGQTDIAARGADLAARYPQDPRAHVFAADGLLTRGDRAGGVRELRAAIRLADDAGAMVRPAFVNVVRGTLATVLFDEGRREEARQAARDACAARDEAAPPAALMELLARRGLCGVRALRTG